MFKQLGNSIQTIRGYDPINGRLDYLQSGPNGSIQNLKYTWDRVGNLQEREDVRQNGLKEHFYYDDLHRLDYSTLNGTTNLDMSYDAMGNIQSKTGLGTYTYHFTKKHAVASAGSHAFTYDDNGNQVTRDGLAVTWYGFNLPKQISAAGNNSSTFMYNAHDLRWSQTAIYGGVTETTTYIGGLMEIVVRGGVTAYRHYISGGTGTVAEYIRDTTGLSVTRYITKDHLGSPDAITDSSGAVIVRMSHDAFGDGRNASGWSGAVPSSDMGNIAAHTRRGFTEHDMLDNLRLIHMNGRVFDPVIGRFISADPFIDGVGSTQGWNRYSYVGNNPLSVIDPTGYAGTAPYYRIDPRQDPRRGLGFSVDRTYDFGASDWSDSRIGATAVGDRTPDHYRYIRNNAGLFRQQFVDRVQRELGHNADTQKHLYLPRHGGGSTAGRFANDGVMNPIYLPSGTVAMNLPQFVYQQCAMSMCHGNMDLPFTRGYLNDEQSQSLAIEGGITVFGWPIGGSTRLIPWSSRAIRAAVEALEVGATEVRVGSRSEAAELFLGRYQGAGYRNTTGWSPREVKDFFGSKAGTYHWDEGLDAFPHDASHLQIHTLEGPVIRIYFPD